MVLCQVGLEKGFIITGLFVFTAFFGKGTTKADIFCHFWLLSPIR